MDEQKLQIGETEVTKKAIVLLSEDTVYFNCGSHTISLRMKRADLVEFTGAQIVDFHKTDS